ncbi:MAG: hypothetical protein MJ197_10520 [Bacteroidales bacterium]|nr:hypothetical protein [Bacteroidales bacterium]
MEKDKKCLECIRLGNVYDDEKFNGGNFGGNVWSGGGTAPTMKTGASASQQCTIDIIHLGSKKEWEKLFNK